MKSKRAKIDNSRKVLIVLSILLIILALICFTKNNNYSEIDKSENSYTVTMLGGGNLEENVNLNSMGYLIQTQNNKLIIVDGGRETDVNLVIDKIKSLGNGKVDYWFLTHAHNDHIGALVQLLENNEQGISIDNLCYNFNSKEWYQKYDPERCEVALKFLDYIDKNPGNIIKNIKICNAGEVLEIDNLSCKILRVSNPSIVESKYTGNEASMVFKFLIKKQDGTFSDKDILFLGDSYIEAGKELINNCYDDLKSYAVQMAHHGQDGVSKEVYDVIDPSICFFNAPKWLYENDNGGGYNSGKWKSIEVRSWLENSSLGKERTFFQAYNGDIVLKITDAGYQIIDK